MKSQTRAGDIAEISQKSTATERVARCLRDAIVSGGLDACQRVAQEAIAAACGTSRLPVREALHQLANEGFVVLTPNVGAQVGGFDLEDLNQVYEIRERLEPLAISRSAPFLTDADLAQMEELQRRMEGITEPDPPDIWLELDRDFHSLAFAGRARLQRHLRRTGVWLSSHYRLMYEVAVILESEIAAGAGSPLSRIGLSHKKVDLES
jgi:DNA-binding GntR family transcriptional regulator